MVLRTSLNKTRIMFSAIGEKSLLRVAWSVDRKFPCIFCKNTSTDSSCMGCHVNAVEFEIELDSSVIHI